MQGVSEQRQAKEIESEWNTLPTVELFSALNHTGLT